MICAKLLSTFIVLGNVLTAPVAGILCFPSNKNSFFPWPGCGTAGILNASNVLSDLLQIEEELINEFKTGSFYW